MAPGSITNRHWSGCHYDTAFYMVTRDGGCKITVHGRKLFTIFFVMSEFNVGELKRQLKM